MNTSIIADLRTLLAPERLGKGAIRLEDWNERPEEQREAHVRLRGWTRGALDNTSGRERPSACEVRRRTTRLQHLVVASLCLSLPSCGLGNLHDLLTNPCGDPCPSPAPQDCAALSRMTWSVEGVTPPPLAVGASAKASLFPFLESQCVNSVSSVVWTSDNRSVASVLPLGGKAPTEAWVTGVAAGETAVGAQIVFSDGTKQGAEPKAIQVIATGSSPGSVLIVQGVVPIGTPSSHDQLMAWVPFQLSKSGFVDIVVDWDSPLDSVGFTLYPGTCSSIDNCAIPIWSVGPGSKPVSLTHYPLSAGSYTIRIASLGPGAENLRYSVRFSSS